MFSIIYTFSVSRLFGITFFYLNAIWRPWESGSIANSYVSNGNRNNNNNNSDNNKNYNNNGRPQRLPFISWYANLGVTTNFQ